MNDQDLGTKLHEMWAKVKWLRLCIYSHVFRAAVYILCVYYTDMNDVWTVDVSYAHAILYYLQYGIILDSDDK